MLDRLCSDTCGHVFKLLTPLEVSAARGCSRALAAALDPTRARRIWEDAGRNAAPLAALLKFIPTGRGAAAFVAIYPNALRAKAVFTEAALQYACSKNWVDKAQWLIKNTRIRGIAVWCSTPGGFSSSALELACRGGHLELVQLLVTTFKIPAVAVIARHGSHIRLFQEVCAAGHLGLARWLATHFAIDFAKFRPICNEVLQEACAHDRVAVVVWLLGHYPYAYSELLGVFLRACRANAPFAAWLITTGTIARIVDFKYDRCHAMRTLCEHGHLEVARMFAARFDITAASVREYQDLNYLGMIRTPLEVMRWLTIACTHGHFHIADWLTAEFELKRADGAQLAICELIGYGKYITARSDYEAAFPAIRWLMRRFRVQVSDVRRFETPYTPIGCAKWYAPDVEWLEVQDQAGQLS